MVEVQVHGFSFEQWVRNTLFQGYQGNYSQKWDVPPECNQHEAIPASFRNLPVSIKTAKYGSPIGLGDVLRQRSIQESFLMIVGFWKQRSSLEKWFEDIGCVRFSPEVWNSLWGNLSIEQIQELDKIVKNTSENYSIVRQQAQQWKRDIASQSDSSIVINPKIDSKKQRRVQCSLPFNIFWSHVGHTPTSVDSPELFGFRFANPVLSSARSFNQRLNQDETE